MNLHIFLSCISCWFRCAVVWPCAYQVVEGGSRAVRLSHVPVSVQLVVAADIPLVYPTLDQRLDGRLRFTVWDVCHVVTHNGYGVGLCVVSLCMRSDHVPATPLVDVSIFANQKAIANIRPTYNVIKCIDGNVYFSFASIGTLS